VETLAARRTLRSAEHGVEHNIKFRSIDAMLTWVI